ncbi:hypothetical protein [Pseudomonas juntendi]
MDYAPWYHLSLYQEVNTMGIKSRRVALVMALSAVAALYGSACWRAELLRSQPSTAASCEQAHCVPHTATLSAVR